MGLNKVIENEFTIQKKTEKRSAMYKSIEKRKVKCPLSFFQQVLKENGLLNIDEEEDEEEESEDAKDDKKKEEEKEEDDIQVD